MGTVLPGSLESPYFHIVRLQDTQNTPGCQYMGRSFFQRKSEEFQELVKWAGYREMWGCFAILLAIGSSHPLQTAKSSPWGQGSSQNGKKIPILSPFFLPTSCNLGQNAVKSKIGPKCRHQNEREIWPCGNCHGVGSTRNGETFPQTRAGTLVSTTFRGFPPCSVVIYTLFHVTCRFACFHFHVLSIAFDWPFIAFKYGDP